MVYSIGEIQELVQPVVKKYQIPALYLFGSYARGEATEESDLDFLVDTEGTDLTSLLKLGALYCDLEKLFDKRLDLITERSIMQIGPMPTDVELRDNVMKERVRLNAVS